LLLLFIEKILRETDVTAYIIIFSLIQQLRQFTFVDYLFNNCSSFRDLVAATEGFLFFFFFLKNGCSKFNNCISSLSSFLP
ncbi:hypothetical protein ACMBCN_01785, partial [Candidatus Liberibacter asiaticus]|nr:hypothetical protein [Candidatus Liberibacter asiaticus]